MANILLFGQAAFGKAVLDGLVERGHHVLRVCMPPAGSRPDPLAERAGELGLPVLHRKSWKGEEAASQAAASEADIGLLAFVTQIIPLPLLDSPRLGSICFHPSLLPKYRGGSALAWQLIRGETKSGVTLFRPDAGVDTGPIYVQKEVDVAADDSAGSLYFSKLFPLGVEATLESVDLLASGQAEPRVQDESQASADPLCKDEHAAVDWNRPAIELHNLIRGCDPAPGAHCRWNGEPLRLYGSRRIDASSDHAPGTVVATGDEGLDVAVADGVVRVTKLAYAGEKGAAVERAAAIGIDTGSILS